MLGGVQGRTHVTEPGGAGGQHLHAGIWPDRIARQIAVSADARGWPDKSTLGFVNHRHAWRQDGATLAQEYPRPVPPKP
ncbi:MAG: hypothetical protein IPL72_13135 [Sulfuritalea sp.]|nr:hypothetical protein [Sulfuritalea sp.]